MMLTRSINYLFSKATVSLFGHRNTRSFSCAMEKVSGTKRTNLQVGLMFAFPQEVHVTQLRNPRGYQRW